MTNSRKEANGVSTETLALSDLNVVEQLELDNEQNDCGGSSIGHWFKKNAANLGIAGGETAAGVGVFVAIAVLGD